MGFRGSRILGFGSREQRSGIRLFFFLFPHGEGGVCVGVQRSPTERFRHYVLKSLQYVWTEFWRRLCELVMEFWGCGGGFVSW